MAYTKYSLTPANNTAAPPDGAPEGMLPSAVNDTMRDMMAQIRDCGDGIRDGTYTMTAPKITGGTITGSTINNSAIGATTASTGAFSTLSATGATTFSGATVVSGSLTANTFSSSGATITGGTINSTAIGGTTAAAGKFTTLEATGVTTVQAGSVSAPAITTSGDTNTGIFFPAADTIAFTEGGAEVARFDSSGNLGIGTTSPTGYGRTLQVAQNAGDDATFSLGTASAGSTSNVYLNARPGSSANFFLGTQNGAILFATGLNTGTSIGTERMRIESGGRLLIGTTSTSSFDEGMRVNPTGTGGSMQVIISTTGGGTPFLLNTTADTNIINFYRSSTNVGTISVSTTNTAYNTSSDYRLKENIAPMTGALAKVTQLKPCTYTWKANGSAGQGFIAHELQAVVPDSVTGVKDAVDDEGNPVHQGVDTSYLVATLTSAIQELKAELDATKAEVQALKGVA